MPAPATAYPDDLQQNREDRRNPPIRQSQAMHGRDHAHQNQGGGTTALGSQRAAAPVLSALAPIAGRDHLPGDDIPHDEPHWDAPLPVVVRLAAAGGRELRTLRAAGAFVSGAYMTLEHSAALQKLAGLIITAARSGHPDDLADAGIQLQAYVRRLHLN